MTDTLPPPIERVRMAFAEVGYDPGLVKEASPRLRSFGAGHAVPSHWPIEVRWRAHETALLADPRCLACYTNNSHRINNLGLPRLSCDATRRFVPDCGRNRDEAT